MARKILALVAGFITFALVITVVQLINGLIFGMPHPDVIGNPQRMAEYVAQMSVGGFVGLLFSYVIGSFAAGFVMRKISRWDSLILPIVIGLIGTIGWIFNIAQIPHPMWVTIAGFLCYIPFAILGHRTGK